MGPAKIQSFQYWTGGREAFETLLYQSRGNGAPGESKGIMLQQFSWQQFLIALGALALVWYLAVILLFYRKELRSLLSGSGWRSGSPGGSVFTGAETVLPHRWQKGVDAVTGSGDGFGGVAEVEDELMGKSKMPEGMSTVNMDQVSFFSGGDGLEDRDVEDQQGLVPDVLQDIKEVFAILVKEDGSKQDFIRLMETVRLSYPGLSAHPALRRVNAFISEHASFHLSAQELEDLWN